MTKAIILVAVLAMVLGGTEVGAQGIDRVIGVYPYSTSSSECWIEEPAGGGVMSVYIVYDQIVPECVQDIAFRLVVGGGFTGTYLGESIPHGISIGDTQDGILILVINGPSPVQVATVQYMTYDTSPPCSWLEVTASPEYGFFMANCDGESYDLITRGKLSVNVLPDPRTCEHVWCVPVGTERSTWGSVKALYGP